MRWQGEYPPYTSYPDYDQEQPAMHEPRRICHHCRGTGIANQRIKKARALDESLLTDKQKTKLADFDATQWQHDMDF